MKTLDIFIANMYWHGGKKIRPVLVLLLGDEHVSVYQITTQYESKSASIQAYYFRINDWAAAGLDRPSYVDTGTLIKLPLSTINNKTPIGTLTASDKERLRAFLS